MRKGCEVHDPQPIIDWLNEYLKLLTNAETQKVFLEMHQSEIPDKYRAIKLLNTFLDMLGIHSIAMMVDEDSGDIKGFCKYNP